MWLSNAKFSPLLTQVVDSLGLFDVGTMLPESQPTLIQLDKDLINTNSIHVVKDFTASLAKAESDGNLYDALVRGASVVILGCNALLSDPSKLEAWSNAIQRLVNALPEMFVPCWLPFPSIIDC